MKKTIDVHCPDCGQVIPVEIQYETVTHSMTGETRRVARADKFEPWSHGLVCPKGQRQE